MHSSRMRAIRCRSRLPGCGCLGGGVCLGGIFSQLYTSPPPSRGQYSLTHACENITFSQLRLRTVINNCMRLRYIWAVWTGEGRHPPDPPMLVKVPLQVIPFAPDFPITNDYTTFAMSLIDTVLSHVGVQDDGLGPAWSPVERIAHMFHMIDLWETIRPEFEGLVKYNPVPKETCDCLLDVKNNGIEVGQFSFVHT